MRNADFLGYGEAQDEGTPVFAWEAELEEGKDLDGKFSFRFNLLLLKRFRPQTLDCLRTGWRPPTWNTSPGSAYSLGRASLTYGR